MESNKFSWREFSEAMTWVIPLLSILGVAAYSLITTRTQAAIVVGNLPAMQQTLAGHETRIAVIETGMVDIKKELDDISKDVKWLRRQ